MDGRTDSSSKPTDVKELILQRVGFLPKDAYGWLYACRGLYQQKEYAMVVEGLTHCLRHDGTSKEALHLLAFSLLHTKQNKAAAAAFYKSILAGNETDWQPLVELCIEIPSLQFQSATTSSSAASTSLSTSSASASASSATGSHGAPPCRCR